MLKLVTAFAAVGCITLASVAALADAPNVPVGVQAIPAACALSPDQVAKIREEIRINEGRAKELEPIIARDRQARNDVETDWKVLERHARELHARANEFRQIANILSGQGANDLNQYAKDFDVFATHDEENARRQHQIGEHLDKLIESEADAKNWHLRVAGQLREWLQRNGC